MTHLADILHALKIIASFIVNIIFVYAFQETFFSTLFARLQVKNAFTIFKNIQEKTLHMAHIMGDKEFLDVCG